MVKKKITKDIKVKHTDVHSCHVVSHDLGKFPSHAKEKKRLNRVKGQLEGIERMINDNRYCMDIIFQLRAASSALKALEKEIMHTHLKSCVKMAMESDDQHEAQIKIQEIMDLF